MLSSILDTITRRLRGADDHDRTRDRLSEYADGALPPADRAWVEAHLASCDSCQSELDELRETVAMLHSLPTARVPRSFMLTAPAVPARAPRPAGFWPSSRALAQATGALGALFALLLAGSALLQPMASMAPSAASRPPVIAPAPTTAPASAPYAAAAPTTAPAPQVVAAAPTTAAARVASPALAQDATTSAAAPTPAAAAPTTAAKAVAASTVAAAAAATPVTAAKPAAAAPTKAPAPTTAPAAAATAVAAPSTAPVVSAGAAPGTATAALDNSQGKAVGESVTAATPTVEPSPTVYPTPTAAPEPTSEPVALTDARGAAESTTRDGYGAASGPLTGPLGIAELVVGGAAVALAGVTGLTWLRERRTRRNGGNW